MPRALFALALTLAFAWPPEAGAQDYGAIRANNALSDLARVQERQAESLRRIELIQRVQARADDRARRNAERDSRSMRRFDR